MAQRQFIISSPIFHVDADDGTPLAGGKIYVYEAGTTTAKTIYQNSNLRADSAHSQPITLDSRGETVIYGEGNYKFVITDSDGVAVKTIDEIRIVTVSSFGETLIDDASAVVARTTLGLGSAATLTAGTGANNVLLLSTSGYLPALNGSLLTNLSISSISNTLPPGHLNGLTITPGTTSISIAAGACCDFGGTRDIRLTTAITKILGAWTEGTGGGIGVATLVANTWYHVHMIRKTADDGNIDAMISTSINPTSVLPSNYSYYRRIGSIKANSAGTAFLAYTQNGDEFSWNTVPALDQSVTDLGNTETAYTLASVPLGIKVEAMLNIYVADASGAGVYIYPTTSTEQSPVLVTIAAPLWTAASTAGWRSVPGRMRIFTDTSQQINAIASTTSTTLKIAVLGWIDRRGRDD